LDLTNWSLANPVEFSKELKAEKPAEVYACVVLPTVELLLCPRTSSAASLPFLLPRKTERPCQQAAVKIQPKTPQTAVTVAVASADIPPRAMSDDNDDVALSDNRQSKKETPVVLLDEYASFADVFSEEKASQLPELPDAEHKIDTGNNKVPFSWLYNLSDYELGQLQDYLANAKAKG